MSNPITFIQNFIPPLEAGQYQVTVQQNLLNANPQGASDTIDESYVNVANIAVCGERFTLDPAEVESVFPPAGNQGEYSNVLPHVLLRRRTLLWERSPTASAQGYPWLALLLFDANDPPPALATVQLGDLQRSPFVCDPDGQKTRPSNLPTTAVSYVDGCSLLGQTFGPDYGESYSDQVQVIDVDVDLFSAIAPSLADLAWLGCARTVPTTKKAGDPSEAPGTFSLAICNRMPTPNTKCVAHLVSLECMSPFLPTGSDYTPAAFTLPDGEPASLIRLVSLRSWSFTSVDPKQSFEGYLTNLDVGPLQRSGVFAQKSSDTGPESVVSTAFGLGYTAVNHQTRQGDTTVSWYRGPFVPFSVPSTLFIPAPDPSTNLPSSIINTADQLVRYDPKSGLMDVTYAAAWELGRLVGLANKSFSLALYNWRRSGQRAVARAVHDEAVQERFGQALALAPPRPGGVSQVHRAAAEFIRLRLKPLLVEEDGR